MNFKNLLSDARPGIFVFLVALPLCLGIALAWGVSLFPKSDIVGGIVVTALSGNKYNV